MIMLHHDFKSSDPQQAKPSDGLSSVSAEPSKFLKRYVALYVLFKSKLNLYNIQDDAVKSFYM